MGTVFTIASAKGGVGKTTTTAALGTTLAAAGNDVVVVDGDIGMANLATVLGFDPDGPTLHAVLSGDAAVEMATYEGPEGLAVVPGSTDIDDFREADATDLGHVVEELRTAYDYVLLDTGAGLSHDNALPLGLADEVVLVSSPEPPALIDTDKTRQLADRLDANVRGLVLTRVTENVTFEIPEQVNLDIPVLARVPYDEAVVTSFAARRPLCTHAPDSDAAAAYRDLAEELTGEQIPVPAAVSDGDDVDAESDLGSLPDDFEDMAEEFDEIAADVAGDESAAADPDPASGVAAADSSDDSGFDADGDAGGEPDDGADPASPGDAVEHGDVDAGTADHDDPVGSGDVTASDAPEESPGSIDTGVATALERAESTVDREADAGAAVEDDDPAVLVEEAEENPPSTDDDSPAEEYPTVLVEDADGVGASGDDAQSGESRDDADEDDRERGGFFRRLLGG
jgi:septum site-determining protein MinD